MTDADLVDINALNNVFPKKAKGISKIQILKFQKSSSGILHYNNSAGNLEQFSQLNLRQNCAGKLSSKLPTLLPTTSKPELKPQKVRDLIELLQFVSPIHHPFYLVLQNLAALPQAQVSVMKR